MPPAKRKRIITDRRREQNRDAQKIYRAKIKARLERLEELQHPAVSNRTTPVEHQDASVDEDSVAENAIQSSVKHNKNAELSLHNTSLQSCEGPPKRIESFEIRPYLSDPRMNHLYLPHISLISAGLENSLSLNISKADALTPGFPSPFNSALATNLETLRPDWWSSIPRDLYPSRLQLSIPHQAWLDSIPVPSFRDNVLTYLAAGLAQNPNFNLTELADDIDCGGLVCWGGVGNKGGTGTPWDARSWEARPWFLDKWQYVTGGLHGELGTMSMWWWRLKGEDAPPLQLNQ